MEIMIERPDRKEAACHQKKLRLSHHGNQASAVLLQKINKRRKF